MRFVKKYKFLIFSLFLATVLLIAFYLTTTITNSTYTYTSNFFRDYSNEFLFSFEYPTKFDIDVISERWVQLESSCVDSYSIINFDIHPNYDDQYFESFSEYFEKLEDLYSGRSSLEYLGIKDVNGTSFHHVSETFYNNRNIEGIASEYSGREYLILFTERYFVELSMNYSPYTCIGKKFDLRSERESILETLEFNQDII